MKKKIIRIKRLPDPTASFSRALVLDDLANCSMIIVSGTASVGPKERTMFKNDFEAQARHTYDNIKALLKAAGASLKDVVEYTVFLKNMDDYGRYNKIRDEVFRENGITKDFPASTCVEARLCRDDLLIEINAKAFIHPVS